MQKYFCGNYVFPSPKSSEDQKKGHQRNLGLNLAGICGIYSGCQALFCLSNQHSNLDGETLNLNGGDTNSRWGDASPQQFEYWVAPPLNQAASEK